jgi:hypothetical protein
VGTHGSHINPAKCFFGVTEVTFLGYTVSAEGMRPLEEKCGRVCCEIMQWVSTFCRNNNAFIIVVWAADTKRWYPLNQTAFLTLFSHINFHPVTFKVTASEWCQKN